MWIFWDIAIFFLVVMHAILILYFLRKHKKLLVILISFSLLHLLQGSIIEPRRIVIQEQDVMILENAKSEPLKVALLSDLHLGPYKKKGFVRKIHKKLVEQNPELVLITGDFIYNKSSVSLVEELSIIAEDFKTFAVLGNHDYHVSLRGDEPVDEELASEVRSILATIGIQVLDNAYSLEVPEGKNPIWIVGLDSWSAQKENIDQAIQGTITSYPKILMSHSPDGASVVNASHAVDLVVSGHTHGGQIRLPLWGSVPRMPIENQKFDKGLFSLEDTQMYVTSGIGEMGPRARLYNPPEIVMLNLFY